MLRSSRRSRSLELMIALIAVAQHEQRCLITFDLEFGNPLLFDLTEHSGVVVIRLSKAATLTEIGLGMETLFEGCGRHHSQVPC
jgi:uncharacterized protein DUF5615